MPFAAATAGKPAYEVCRLFLASLQLSNNGNVRLHHADGRVCGPADLRVEVLSNVMAEDRFDAYLAPSLIA